MCGVAGTVGISNCYQRYKLVSSLGIEIDARGGDACGFVSYNNRKNKLEVGRKLGYWSERRRQFIERASNAHLTMMHSRYATCGEGKVEEAHPFAIKRKGRIVLYGVHNGRVYNAYQSAKAHKRKITVDSEEIFELLADNDFEGICNLEGYGVITWVDTNNPKVINLLCLSEDSDIYVVQTKDGKVIYGSTPDIVHSALKDAGLKFEKSIIIDIGTVYSLTDAGVFYTELEGIRFKKKKAPEYDPGIDWASAWRHAFESYHDTSNDNNDEKKTSKSFKKKSRSSQSSSRRKDGTFGERGDFISLDDLFELSCENCGDEIDEDEIDELSFLYENQTGCKASSNLYCKDCLVLQ